MKGIILAGGKGSRLFPITMATCKQLLPIYNKPMIYYPLTTLMNAGIRDILIITTPKYQQSFKDLLGNGKDLGIKISYIMQSHPGGLAQAFIIGEDFIGNDTVCLILGDNIFHGNINDKLYKPNPGATIFVYHVKDPNRYGVLEFGPSGEPLNIVEKPQHPKSHYAVTGLYFYNNSVVSLAKNLKPSSRGELEITDINKIYIKQKNIVIRKLGIGTAWLDTGTYDSLMQASQFVEAVEKRTGNSIGSIHETAWRMGWINDIKLKSHAEFFNTDYGHYLFRILEEKNESHQ